MGWTPRREREPLLGGDPRLLRDVADADSDGDDGFGVEVGRPRSSSPGWRRFWRSERRPSSPGSASAVSQSESREWDPDALRARNKLLLAAVLTFLFMVAEFVGEARAASQCRGVAM